MRKTSTPDEMSAANSPSAALPAGGPLFPASIWCTPTKNGAHFPIPSTPNPSPPDASSASLSSPKDQLNFYRTLFGGGTGNAFLGSGMNGTGPTSTPFNAVAYAAFSQAAALASSGTLKSVIKTDEDVNDGGGPQKLQFDPHKLFGSCFSQQPLFSGGPQLFSSQLRALLFQQQFFQV